MALRSYSLYGGEAYKMVGPEPREREIYGVSATNEYQDRPRQRHEMCSENIASRRCPANGKRMVVQLQQKQELPTVYTSNLITTAL